LLGFEVVLTVGTKMAVFAIIMAIIALRLEAVRISVILLTSHQSTLYYNPEDSRLLNRVFVGFEVHCNRSCSINSYAAMNGRGTVENDQNKV
jgi:hypothetical protein